MPPKLYRPLRADHPLITGDRRCHICGEPFAVDDITCLLDSGPATLEDSVRAAKGEAYNVISDPVHAECYAELGLPEKDE